MTGDGNAADITAILDEIADLERALVDADDGAKASRLRIMIESRRARIRELQREVRRQ